MPITLVAICVGQPQTRTDPRRGEWTSAIWKRSVSGPIHAGRLGLTGDAVANPEAHGGVDKAVLAYSADHAARWAGELPDLDTAAGAFGENLSLSGCDERSVCLGDRVRIGEATFEVSHPRQPCWKLALRHGQPDLPKRTIATHRTGWYLRVIDEGEIVAGDIAERIARPHPDWPLSRVADVFYGHRAADHEREAEELASLSVLAEAWRETLT